MKIPTPKKLTTVGFGAFVASRSNRKGEWVVVEETLSYGDPTGRTIEVFIGSHRECLDYASLNDIHSNLTVLKVG